MTLYPYPGSDSCSGFGYRTKIQTVNILLHLLAAALVANRACDSNAMSNYIINVISAMRSMIVIPSDKLESAYPYWRYTRCPTLSTMLVWLMSAKIR